MHKKKTFHGKQSTPGAKHENTLDHPLTCGLFPPSPKKKKKKKKKKTRRGGGGGGGEMLSFTISVMNDLLDTKVGVEKLDLYLSTSSYSVGKQLLNNLSVVGIKSGGKNLVKVYC